jgi:hypothetical protein
LHYIHGSRAQPLYPSNGGRTAYATVGAAGQQHSTVGARCIQQPDNGSFCLAPTLIDHRAPSSAASSLAASQQQVHTDYDVEKDLEDDEVFAQAIQGMQNVKARWNSPV